VKAKVRTIINAAFQRRVTSEPHDDTSGDQMDLMNGEFGPNNSLSGRARYSIDIERGR
jgi:hypothetical protein